MEKQKTPKETFERNLYSEYLINLIYLHENDSAKKFLKDNKSFDPNYLLIKDDRVTSALHTSIMQSNLEMFKILLTLHDIDVNVKACNLRQTPLHTAVHHGKRYEYIELLLSHPNIDPYEKDNKGKTAFQYALEYQNICGHDDRDVDLFMNKLKPKMRKDFKDEKIYWKLCDLHLAKKSKFLYNIITDIDGEKKSLKINDIFIGAIVTGQLDINFICPFDIYALTDFGIRQFLKRGKFILNTLLRKNNHLLSIIVGQKNLNINLQDFEGRTALHKTIIKCYKDDFSFKLLISDPRTRLDIKDKNGNDILRTADTMYSRYRTKADIEKKKDSPSESVVLRADRSLKILETIKNVLKYGEKERLRIRNEIVDIPSEPHGKWVRDF